MELGKSVSDSVWRSVENSVRDYSVLDSVSNSVYYSVLDSVLISVRNSVVITTRNIKHETR
jgi:hypothetical protein